VGFFVNQANKNLETKFQSETNCNETISALKTTISASDKTQIAKEKIIEGLIKSITQQANSSIESYNESELIISPAASSITSEELPPTPTDTPSPAPTNTPAPTPLPYFEEEFNNNENFWETPSYTSNEGLTVNQIITGGQYKITIKNRNSDENLFWIEVPFNKKKKNFCFEFDGNINTNNPKYTFLGLFYRRDSTNFYLISIYPTKSKVGFGKNGDFQNIFDETFPKSVDIKDGINNYRICVKDNLHEIYINDFKISEINDLNISNEGIFTFYLFVYKGTEAEFLIDNIKISEYY